MAVKFTNNAATTLAAGINSSATSISVTDGSVFPSLSSGEHFYCTFDDTTNVEIVKVTARSSNTLTVVRGQDNTTARAFSSGDKAELRVVAALLEDVKTEVTSTLSVDTFTGDDATTAFTLSQAPASEDNLIVFIEGVYQNPNDFVLNGTTLTLDSAPLAGRKIVVYHVSAAVSGNNLNHDQFTANGSTAAFTLSIAPIHENNTQVFIDGVYQQKDSYAVSGTTLTLDANPANGAKVEVMTFTQTDVNTLPASFVSGLTEVTAVGADHMMIFDATDSALKKALVSDVIEGSVKTVQDADGDTKIQVEESSDEDTIRFDIAGSEKVTLDASHLTLKNATPSIRFMDTDDADNSDLGYIQYTGGQLSLFADDNGDIGSSAIRFNTDGSEDFRIHGTNNADSELNSVLQGVGTDGSTLIDVIRMNKMGYGASYQVTQIGMTGGGRNLSLNYDPSTNTSGGFNGNGEILIPNNKAIIAPNAANNSFLGVLRVDANDDLLIGGGNYQTNGYIKVDLASGDVTKPSNTSFKACLGANITRGAGNAKFAMTTELFDEGGNYDTTSSRFTAPVTGTYLFYINLALAANTSDYTYVGAGFNNNGNVHYGGWGHKNALTGSTYGKNCTFIIFELSANDYVEPYVELSGASNVLGTSNGAYTHWGGYLIG